MQNPKWKTTKTPKRQPLRVPLNQAEVNQLLAVLGVVSRTLQVRVANAKQIRNEAWRQSDKTRAGEPLVDAAFEALNQLNTALAKAKKQQKLLSGTIAKLKTHR